jgi:hypothetical protein
MIIPSLSKSSERALLHIWQRSRQTDKFGHQVVRPVSKACKVSRVLFLFPSTAAPVDIVLASPWIFPARDGRLSAIKDGGKIATPGLVLGSHCLG